MPQLDPSSFPSQLFWMLVTFAVLYFVLARYAIPAIARVLQSRQERIGNDLDKASVLRTEAEALEGQHKVLLEQTNVKALDVIARAQKEAVTYANGKQAELEASLHQKTAEAEKKIAAARDKAYGEISEISSELAVEIVRKLADMKLNKRQADAVIKQSM